MFPMVQPPRDISDEPRLPELRWRGRTQRSVMRDGRYKLVRPAALSSIPTLMHVSRYGDTDSTVSKDVNLLIEGDALDVLTAVSDAEAPVLTPIKLAYLDPPFNTQSAFADYHDALD